MESEVLLMALYGMADNNVNIPANRDGAMYNTFAGGNDYIFDGIGDEFEIVSSGSSFLITLGTGEGIVGGRHITEVTENGTNSMIQLDANDTGYVVLRMDLTQPAGSEAYLYATPTIVKQDLNNGGTTRDLVLYAYVTDGSGVTSFVDMRQIQSSAGSPLITGTLTAGSTSIILSDASIQSNSALDFYTDTWGVSPTAVSVSTGSVTLTFDAQASNMVVGVIVKGEY